MKWPKISFSLLFCILLLTGCPEKPLHNANWYYYWEKDNVVPGLDRNGNPASRWDWSVEGENADILGANSPEDNGYMLTDLCIDNPVSRPFEVEHIVTLVTIWIGGTTNWGIEMVAATAEHETQHQRNYDFIQAGNADTDGDGLADNQEGIAPYNFVVGQTDTWQLSSLPNFQDYADYGDNEVTAREVEDAGVATINLNEDWSVDGAQWDQ
jgi:hypothetical protein